MMGTRRLEIGGVPVGGGSSLLLVAGPCVIENEEMCLELAEGIKRAARAAGMGFVFKASFDKANRSSADSFRGVGLERGLKIMAKVKAKARVPVLSDIHLPEQAGVAAEVLDALQIPAFLCRQTDLIVAAAKTGKPVNVKKGQFMSPEEMGNAVEKARSAGNGDVSLTERGTTFGYHDLVVDMRGLVTMREFGVPVLFDGTHSVMSPGGRGKCSGGNRAMAAHLCRAAAAVGVDGFYLEVHRNPDKALSDPATQLPLAELEGLLGQLVRIDRKSVV
jgi:2-dehydro-3-deoxyphosphooctonate aldolase (KDO 8-P synthase)